MQYMNPHHHQAPPAPAQPQPQPQQQQQLPPHPAAQAPPASVPMSLPVMPQPQAPAAAQMLAAAQMQPYGGVQATAPSVVAVPVANHPPYAQMITEAILALNEREGSSKRAIGKFIDKQYSTANLPQGTHSVLLTSHLKKLKEQGIIHMVKHSYTLPNMVHRSEAVAPTPTSNGAVKRRGRPPKPKTPVTDFPAQPAPAPEPTRQLAAATVTQNEVFASLGLSDGPVHVPVAVEGASSGGGIKRGRGRPPKKNVSGVPAALQPTGIIGKKSPGRPRKVAAKNAINSGVAVAGPVAGAQKQPRLKLDGTPAKPRGRKPKNSVPVQEASAPAVTGGFLAPAEYIGEGAIDPTAGSAPLPKRRGRPSLKVQNGTVQSAKSSVPKIPRKLSGKPLGRPRKIASPSGFQGPSGQQSYNEIKSQLDFLQSKVKESVNILKPCFEGNAGIPGEAVSALRELEQLGNNVTGGVPVQQPPQQS